jgi:hypothetical protein
MIITVYHNISPDGYFGLNTVFGDGGKRQASTYEERHPLIRVFTYEQDDPTAADPEGTALALCELAFLAFNVGADPGFHASPEIRSLATRYRARRLRALSVGDVLVLNNEAAYACASVGFQRTETGALRVISSPQEAERMIRERYQIPPRAPLTVTVPLTEEDSK